MLYHKLTCRWQGLLLLCATLFAATQAQAAPQLLALIATDQPIALQCEAGQYTAELPTLCLQPERRAPQAGKAYRLAHGQSVILTGRLANGETMSIPMTQEIVFAAARTHVAVAVKVPYETVRRYGLINPTIQVRYGVTVVPISSANDEKPQTTGEIAQAIGDRRSLATAFVDRDAERMPAIRLTNQLINLLPVHRRADLELGDRLWETVIQGSKNHDIQPSAMNRAQFNVDLCRSQVQSGISDSLGGCLKGFNDDAMEYLNTELELALKAGS